MRTVIFQSESFTTDVVTGVSEEGAPRSSYYVRADGRYGSYDPSDLSEGNFGKLLAVEGVATLRAWVSDWTEKPYGKAYVGSMHVMLEKGVDCPETFMEIDAYLPVSATDFLNRELDRCDGENLFFTMIAHSANDKMRSESNRYGDSEFKMKDDEMYSAAFYETKFSAKTQALERLAFEEVV
jgi:hypothetical protein